MRQCCTRCNGLGVNAFEDGGECGGFRLGVSDLLRQGSQQGRFALGGRTGFKVVEK
jgi:hypothetical protein